MHPKSFSRRIYLDIPEKPSKIVKCRELGLLGLFFLEISHLPLEMATASPTESKNRVYCQFGKRNLDGMSWLAPLLNNRVGDLLNIEMRHEQLFFIQGDQVLEDIGYNEKGKRFSEADMSKPIHSLGDLERNGYWLVGREYDPEIMREALSEQNDGYYYSMLSNQCQDWTDRLRRLAERIERTRGHPSKFQPDGSASHYSKPVSPTEPASAWMGAMALVLGITAILSPIISGELFTAFIGSMFLLSAASHVGYSLHAKDWRNMLSTLLTALGCLIAGGAILLNSQVALVASGTLIAILIGFHGASSLLLGLMSRPLVRGIGPFAAGLTMLVCAGLIFLRWPVSGRQSVGIWVGLSLVSGGWSTVWLSWTTRRIDESPSAQEVPMGGT